MRLGNGRFDFAKRQREAVHPIEIIGSTASFSYSFTNVIPEISLSIAMEKLV